MNLTGEAIAIIPARGGSKGVPRKNVRLVAGRPLIAWTIDAARASTSIGRVVVSTDDSEIAQVARECGAHIIHRPAEISTDTASSEAALLHALDELEQSGVRLPELLVFLQCTSPLTLPQDIDGTVRALKEQGAASALTVAPFHHFLWRFEDGNAVAINHDKRVRPMRQQRELQYLETGAVYAMKTAGFRAAGHRFFGKTAMHVVPTDRTIEIDDPRDLLLAESLLRRRQEQDRTNFVPTPVQALVLDFDGVFTDDTVTLDQDGIESVTCRRDDGMGISQLKRLGVPMLVLSSETNPVVAARCRKLGIECIQGSSVKRAALSEWLGRRGISRSNVVYVGNDVNDVECMAWVGCGVAVADAKPQAQSAARMLLSKNGGHGAVREICDLILQSTASNSERNVA